ADNPARDYPIRDAVWRAIDAILPIQYGLEKLIARAELLDIDPNWRSELLEIARGRGVHNQAATGLISLTWHNLRFRSRTEIRIAEALDRQKILFLPNCLARLNVGLGRENREADFLICVNGKWGILEVDGEPFHPPSRTAYDHERDRLFRAHGIRVVEHFDAARCFQSPSEVVTEFLEILRKA
ncbi:MAG: hypothetical protein M1298_00780, partial [Chloroflexi bacterium]|nr:hypothetical protein [Chloroflexota bacterium]